MDRLNENEVDVRVSWQMECDNLISDKDNVILSSPTGSGKTQRYEFWAINKPERPIFVTSPIKSLSNQKFREFSAKGYKVGLVTGDVKYIPDGDCDIICCTQEIYNNRYRDLENSTLIVDEFSYIFEKEDRARAYIDSLYFSKAKNILICSATFGNTEVIADYISDLTGRDFYLFTNDKRLTSLEYKGHLPKERIKDSLVIVYSKSVCEKIAQEIYQTRITKTRELLGKKFVIYDPRERNKTKILRFANKFNIHNDRLLELTYMGVIYYHSSLLPKEKLFIEELFENRLIDTVVGTDALSLGVNFPIQNVVFTGIHKGTLSGVKTISKNLFEQIAGRAGRKGYFDNGFVYYCDDFSKDYDFVGSKANLKTSFFKLVDSKQEDACISLTANIADILNGNTTVEDEASFIVKYSTQEKDFDVEKRKIENIIHYINSYDMASHYLKDKFCTFDWDLGYEKALEHCSSQLRQKIDDLSTKLMMLQPYFNEDIGKSYMTEFSPRENCKLFMDILMGKSIDGLIEKYGSSFYELILLKKYMVNLPEKYARNYDIGVIDGMINSMDYTALHPNEYEIEKLAFSTDKPSLRKKTNKKYECPHYFEKVLIGGKKYIKLFKDDERMLVCDYSKDEQLALHYFPRNVKTDIIGIIKFNSRLDILDRVDLGTLDQDDTDTVDMIEGVKTYLRRQDQKGKKKKKR